MHNVFRHGPSSKVHDTAAVSKQCLYQNFMMKVPELQVERFSNWFIHLKIFVFVLVSL